MNKRILLAIDTNISPATQHILCAVSNLVGQGYSSFHLVLLSVIPVPSMSSPALGMYIGHLPPTVTTTEQRSQAEDGLHKARFELQTYGINPAQVELLVRTGLPAEEIIKASRELQVHLIVVGSRGNSLYQRIQRFFVGSISRRVLQLASCPVMIVPPPQLHRPPDLAAWYVEQITVHLQKHTSSLTVFTPYETARQFIPPPKKIPGRKEIAAATLALEQLAASGILCCHHIKGELRYVND
ncbi:MAG: hypothetical protein NVS4B7_10760 [Ktedonobacteraceae bacterium]